MPIASDGRVHMIKCELCGIQEVNATVPQKMFVRGMKDLRWRFYLTEDGTYDSICPDCCEKRDRATLPKLLLGK